MSITKHGLRRSRGSRGWCRFILTAPIALALVLLGGRASQGGSQCVVHGAEDLALSSLHGDVIVDRGDGPSSAVGAPFGFSLGSSGQSSWSPVGRGDAVDFFFAFVEGASDRPSVGLRCRRASLAALASGDKLPLNSLCGAADPDAGATSGNPGDPAGSLSVRVIREINFSMREVWLVFDLANVEGTVSGASTLDDSGDGAVTVTIDIPTATLTTVAIVDVNEQLVLEGAPPATIDFSASTIEGVAAFAPRSDPCPTEGGGCDCSGYYHGWLPGGG